MAGSIRKGQRIASLMIRDVFSSGHGGMAIVVLASPVGNDKDLLALKIAREDRNGEQIMARALMYEVHVLKQLDHPNIVKIRPMTWDEQTRYWANATELRDSNPYFVMEFLTGGTLASYLKKHRLLGAKGVVALGQKVAAALDHVHGKGYAHNDVKPNNIMFRRPVDQFDTSIAPVVIDFSIAAKKGSKNLDGVAAKYSSPEKLAFILTDNLPADAHKTDFWTKSDVWGLGVTLYQSLTGRFPYEGNSPNNVMTTMTRKLPEAISTFQKVPPRLESLVMDGCLEKNAAKRISASDVANELANIV